VKRKKHKRIKVMSDDDESDDNNENDADVVANQIFGDDDDAPVDQDEGSQSPKATAETADAYANLEESEESGEPGGQGELSCQLFFLVRPLYCLSKLPG